MELGEKLKQQRMEAGLSQRQLCEGIVTRNMLSQIENGSAKPSMKTLILLAERLGKNISFFLEETAVLSPNQQVMENARAAFGGGAYAAGIEALEEYRKPDPVFDREFAILWNLCHLEYARQQLHLGKERYARGLLEKTLEEGTYLQEAMERQRLLLLGWLGEPVAERLPSLDEELMLRAQQAQTPDRAEKLLEAVDNQDSHQWQYLRGRIHFAKKQYPEASACLHKAEEAYPKETAQTLEICYREMGDFKQAYFYACKQKG